MRRRSPTGSARKSSCTCRACAPVEEIAIATGSQVANLAGVYHAVRLAQGGAARSTSFDPAALEVRA